MNTNSKTLEVMVQGEGIVPVTINPETTLQQIVDQNGWGNLSFNVDDQLVAPSNWNNTPLWNVSEVWGVQGAKGAI